MLVSHIRPSAHWFTDASGSLGFGAVFGSKWFYGPWGDPWWSEQNIMLLELYPIWLAVKLWGPLVKDSCILVHTDNQALVSVLNKRSTKLPVANALLREISVECMRLNIILQYTHVPGFNNTKADMLSRLQVEKFLQQSWPDMDQFPTPCPNYLLPASYKHMLMSFCI